MVQTRFMAEIISLKKFRKTKERLEKERLAAENRVQHGRSKADKKSAAEKKKLETARHDGAELANVAPDTAQNTKANPGGDTSE